MNPSSILDLGGNTSVGTVSKSHLSLGSPKISADTKHPKRAKHHSGDSSHKIAQLRAKIEDDVTKLLNTGKLDRLYALVYRDVELLCITKHSEQALLAEFIFKEIDKYVTLKIVPRVTECLLNFAEDNAENIAESFLQVVDYWEGILKLLLQLFLYLDRAYLLHHPRNPCIREYGIKKFKESLMIQAASDDAYTKTNDPVCALVSVLFEKMRNDRSNLSLTELNKRLIHKLNQIDPENSLNVNNMLEWLITEGYTKLKRKWLRDKKTYAYIFMLNYTEDLALFTRAAKSRNFLGVLRQKLTWQNFLSDLTLYLEPSLPFLTRLENAGYLYLVRSLCADSKKYYGVDSMKILLTIWGRFIQERTKQAITDLEVIPSILKLWGELLNICHKGFALSEFEFEVRSALTKGLGQKDVASKVVLHLSKYCDSAMKQANMDEIAFSELEKKVLTIFKLIPDKLAFVSVYEKDLSKRILMARKFNFTFEKQLVDSIVSVVGENDENFKLRAMLRDYSKSKSSFSHLSLPFYSQIDFSALVLEKKVWPEIPGFGSDIRIPLSLSQPLSEFEKYFNEIDEKKHKVLDWKSYTLHQLTLSTQFASEKKELQVNLLQAIVLMLFEDMDELSFSQICEATQMGEKLMKRVLASLSTEKYPVLKVESNVIKLNHHFSDKAQKIKLPMGKEKDALAAEAVTKLVEEGRSSEIRSVLVKIMKSHRNLLFTELLGKSIDILTLRGTPQIQEIKNEIEYLILTDYIARDATGTTLNYIP